MESANVLLVIVAPTSILHDVQTFEPCMPSEKRSKHLLKNEFNVAHQYSVQQR